MEVFSKCLIQFFKINTKVTYKYLNKIQIFMGNKIQINTFWKGVSNTLLCKLFKWFIECATQT